MARGPQRNPLLFNVLRCQMILINKKLDISLGAFNCILFRCADRHNLRPRRFIRPNNPSHSLATLNVSLANFRIWKLSFNLFHSKQFTEKVQLHSVLAKSTHPTSKKDCRCHDQPRFSSSQVEKTNECDRTRFQPYLQFEREQQRFPCPKTNRDADLCKRFSNYF